MTEIDDIWKKFKLMLLKQNETNPIGDLNELINYIEEQYSRLSELILEDNMTLKSLHCNVCNQDYYFPYSWFFHCSTLKNKNDVENILIEETTTDIENILTEETTADEHKVNICSGCLLTSQYELYEKHCKHKGIEYNYMIRIYNRYYI